MGAAGRAAPRAARDPRRSALSPASRATTTDVPNGDVVASAAIGARPSASGANTRSSARRSTSEPGVVAPAADARRSSDAEQRGGRGEERVRVRRTAARVSPAALDEPGELARAGSGAGRARSRRARGGATRTPAPRAAPRRRVRSTRASSRERGDVVAHGVEHGDRRPRRRTPASANGSALERSPAPGVVVGPACRGRTRARRRARSTPITAAVLASHAPLPPGPQPASRMRWSVPSHGCEELGHERPGVAVPPVVVLGRGDARVLLDLHQPMIVSSLSVRSHTRRSRSRKRSSSGAISSLYAGSPIMS